METDRSRADDRFDDDPERLRPLLASLPSGPWYVFETFAADGSLAIGVSAEPVAPGTVLIIYTGLTEEIATLAATSLYRWRRRQALL